MIDAEREARLPLWAQGELERLRRRVREVEAELDALTRGESRTYAMVHRGAPALVEVPVSSDWIRFRPGDHDYIDVKLHEDADGWGIDLLGSGGKLIVRPRSSNTLQVALDVV